MDFEGNPILVGAKIFVFTFALDSIDLWYCSMYVARICMACIIGLLDVVDAFYVRYLVFVGVIVIIFGMKYTPTNAMRGENNILDMILPSSPPSIGGVYFHPQNYCCHLRKY